MKFYKIEITPEKKMYVSAFADNYESRSEIEELMKDNALFISRRFKKKSLSFSYNVCYIKKDLAHNVNELELDDDCTVYFKEIKTVDELKLLKFAIMML